MWNPKGSMHFNYLELIFKHIENAIWRKHSKLSLYCPIGQFSISSQYWLFSILESMTGPKVMKICPLQKPLGSHLWDPISLINLLQAAWWLPISLASYRVLCLVEWGWFRSAGDGRVFSSCYKFCIIYLLCVYCLTKETKHSVPSSGPYSKDRLSCEMPRKV